jgi:cytochrome P450
VTLRVARDAKRYRPRQHGTHRGAAVTEKLVVDFDHHSPAYRERGMAIAAEARAQCPVAWTDAHGGYWFVTSLDAASAIQKRPDLFSAHRELGNPDSVYKGISIPYVNSDYGGGFLEMDPPVQLEYRRILNPFLSPSAVLRWDEMARVFTNACIDDIIERGHGDFVEEITNVVPAVLTMAMIGMPLADWVVFNEPAHKTIYTPPDSPERPAVDAMSRQMAAKVFEYINEFRATPSPRPGMLQALMEAEIGGAPLPDIHILGTVMLVIGGGFDTTTALTSNSWKWLAEHPEAKAQLLADPELWTTATEEFVRFFSPSQGTARNVTEDCEIAGIQFSRGDRVLCSFSMPNRDPAHFEDPDTIKLDRFPNRHAAFGLGNHRCIGSNLARMQFKAIMQESLRRIPEYAIDHDGLQRYESVGTINGNKNMPMTFPAGVRQGPGLEATLETWQARLDAAAESSV